MAEVYPVDDVLEKVKDFPPIQRILLATAGTLQSTLSAYFAKPVKVDIKFQSELEATDGPPSLTRNVDLFIDESTVVCAADSEITVATAGPAQLMIQKELGLGQIMESLGIRPKFTLQEVGRNAVSFWRVYTLEGGGVTYEIRETFPMKLY